MKPSIRTSVLIGELDRIHHRSRPHLAYVPTEDFLNSRPLVDFDDETKIIRAETERLMKRIYTSVPHPRSTTPLQIVPYYGHRTNGKYDSHRHYNTVSDDIYNMSHYNEPSARTIGRGHLACVSFAGGRGYPRRKHLYLDENRDIQDEIKFRSYYNKNRAYEDAMSLPTGFASYLLRLQPDNRNGTLTSTEKLHITNILKERKSKISADDNKKAASTAINDLPEKKISTFKSHTTNETVIPIERETKPYKYKSKDPKPYENNVSIINDDVNSSNNHIEEDPQRKLSEPKLAPKPTPIVQPEERTIEIDIEPKQRKESIKSSRKTSKTKIQSEEKEEKIQTKSQDDEIKKQVVEKEIIEQEKVQEQPSTQELSLPDAAKVLKQEPETATENLTEDVINEPKIELDKDDSIIPTNPAVDTDSLIATDNSIVIDNSIGTDPSIATDAPIVIDSPIATEPPVTTQSPIVAEEETIDVEDKGSNNKNIQENSAEDIQNQSMEEKEDILEQNPNKTVIENDEKSLEILDDKIENNESTLMIENEMKSDIEQRIIETAEETVFQTTQVTVSSIVQETSEVVVTSNQIEIENMQKESASEKDVLGLEDKSTSEETPQQTRLPEVVTNQEEPEDSINTKEIRSEDLLNRLNTEASVDYNTPQEKIIEIEIERPDDLEHIIEEVTDIRSHDALRESDTEPLVEEPQSPESELIYNKTTTNDICEVLSDVVEEA